MVHSILCKLNEIQGIYESSFYPLYVYKLFSSLIDKYTAVWIEFP